MSKQRKRFLRSAAFVLPALGLIFIFLLYPIAEAVRQSFYKWSGIAGAKASFVGIENYKAVFSSPDFWLAMRNSFYFMVGGFLILMPLSFLLAKIITSKRKGVRFFKVSYYLPVMLPVTAVGLIWVYILQPDWGLLNSLLKKAGLENLAVHWLGTPNLNVITVVLVNEWIFAGFNMLIFAAGLVAIPEEVYESSKIDGAEGIFAFFYITLPLMKESFKVFSILCICGCLKTFDLMFTMTGGGPNRTSEVPATLLYTEAFSTKNFGRGNAVGVIILVLGLALSIGLGKLMKEKE